MVAQLRIVQATPTQWPNGWPCNANGQLCIDSSGAPTTWINGIGRTAAGVTIEDSVSAVTGVVNGIPVIGSKMALHDYLPIVHPYAFSNGFSTGFE